MAQTHQKYLGLQHASPEWLKGQACLCLSASCSTTALTTRASDLRNTTHMHGQVQSCVGSSPSASVVWKGYDWSVCLLGATKSWPCVWSSSVPTPDVAVCWSCISVAPPELPSVIHGSPRSLLSKIHICLLTHPGTMYTYGHNPIVMVYLA